ncbi:hypothetical protein IVB18_46095 [Bradyrhizobium sp. 186]|uniref:hypothetical protein n=1 Tax=Bradyrhizobium sp. 186 TaxID=2782654 RepID=UPI002000FBB8|nr:hypothetical protein [Bradyrhizobium sp. 186]UPK35261.1 hypothetical protein IVB18_46095 [Bradyrhizobium sp. 186]
MNVQSKPSRKVGASYWSTLTEEQLLRTAFTTNDPESLKGLTEDVPATDELPFVELWYDFRGAKRERLRCVHCRYHNHLAGYVIRTTEGQRFLVGHECGDKLYGADFEILRSDYDEARDYASNLRRWRNLQAVLPSFLEWLAELQCCSAVRTYRDTKSAFRGQLPRLFGAVAVALLRDKGVLSVDERLRDFESENRAVERYEREKKEWDELTPAERKYRKRHHGDRAPQPPQLPMFKVIPKPVMTVRAANFFSDDPLPHQRLADVLAGFEGLVSEINGATLNAAAYEGRKDTLHRERRHTFAHTFKGVFRRLNAFLETIRASIDDVRELDALFRPDSLAVLVNWANSHPKIKERFKMSGRGLIDHDRMRFGPPPIVTLPVSFATPSLEPMEAFVAAINSPQDMTAS